MFRRHSAPCAESRLRRFNRVASIGSAAVRDTGKDFVSRWVADVEFAAIQRREPLPPDEIPVQHQVGTIAGK
jgi:hypothetical protein